MRANTAMAPGQDQGPRQNQNQGRLHRRHQGNSAHHHHGIADRLHRGRLAQRQDQGQEHQRFYTAEEVEIEVKAPNGVSAEQLVDALYAFTDCEVSIASRIVVIKDNRPVEMTVSEVLRENTAQLVATLKRELELKEKQLRAGTACQNARAHLHRKSHLQANRAMPHQRSRAEAVEKGFSPSAARCCATWSAEDIEMLLGVRIRRISLFDINKHREEMDKVKADLEEIRGHLKNVTKYAIAHLEGCSRNTGRFIRA
jgi:topoisomerase-4 subunit A